MPHRFSLAFESKVGEVDTAQTRLNTFSQRLTFAKRRVDTIHGMFNGLIVMFQFNLHISEK